MQLKGVVYRLTRGHSWFARYASGSDKKVVDTCSKELQAFLDKITNNLGGRLVEVAVPPDGTILMHIVRVASYEYM